MGGFGHGQIKANLEVKVKLKMELLHVLHIWGFFDSVLIIRPIKEVKVMYKIKVV